MVHRSSLIITELIPSFGQVAKCDQILLHDCGEVLWVDHVANEKKTVVLTATYQDSGLS